MGCDRAQGWWLSRALPADELAGWLEQHLSPWYDGDLAPI
jgi:EAL domain-containing protein (putative c-di-GMP-specific phosphodiesterase class I)